MYRNFYESWKRNVAKLVIIILIEYILDKGGFSVVLGDLIFYMV